MTEKEYVSFLLLFILCVLGTAFKLWDYFRVRSAVKAERARVGSQTGRIVIKADWRAWHASSVARRACAGGHRLYP